MKYLIIVLLIFICSCNNNKEQKKIENTNVENIFSGINKEKLSPKELPTLDLQKKYPQKIVTLQDIADVEYIVLENNEKALLSENRKVTVTDSLIFTYTKDKYICIFKRDGKFMDAFKHVGGSEKEYGNISKLIVNSEQNELYIHDLSRRSLKVFTYEGDYLRTIKLGNICRMEDIVFCDNQHILIEDIWGVDFDYAKKEKTNPRPYYKISANDGAIVHHLPIVTEKRIRDWYFWDSGEGMGGATTFSTPPVGYVNGELVIADFGQDTVYSYKQNNLSPIAIRKNRIKGNDVPIIATIDAITDKYIIWFAIEKDMKKTVLPDRTYLQDRQTGACIQTKICDANITDTKHRFSSNLRMTANNHTVPSNHILQIYPAYELIELNGDGKLKGELKEIASKLTEEDNPVIMLAKFK